MAQHGRTQDAGEANDQVSEDNLVDDDAAKRLQAAVQRGGGPSHVARSASIPLGTLRNYLRGRAIRGPALVALANATGVSLEWLVGGRGPMLAEDRHLPFRTPGPGQAAEGLQLTPVDTSSLMAQGSNIVPVRRYNAAASAGGGALVEHEQVVEYLGFDRDYLRMTLHRKAEELLVIEARGDSMEPTIRDGDVLTIDIRPARAVENGRLYVLEVEDTLLVKRLERRLDGSLVVHSDNPRYSPQTLDRDAVERLRIIGQVLLVTAPPR